MNEFASKVLKVILAEKEKKHFESYHLVWK